MAPAIKLSRERDNLSSENLKYYLVKVISWFTNLHEMIPFRFLLWGLQLNLCSSPTWSPMSGSLPRPWRSRWLSCWLLPVWTRTILSSSPQDQPQPRSIENSVTLQLVDQIVKLGDWSTLSGVYNTFYQRFVSSWAIPIIYEPTCQCLNEFLYQGAILCIKPF